jgi:hypothetical protein
MNSNFVAFVDRYRIAVIIGVLVLIVGVLAGVSAAQQSSGHAYRSMSQQEATAENAYVELIKTGLNLYYIENGHYPYDTADFLEKSRAEDREDFKNAMAKLQDFKYAQRGDRQAYKVTYMSGTGERKSFAGNYREDYN